MTLKQNQDLLARNFILARESDRLQRQKMGIIEIIQSQIAHEFQTWMQAKNQLLVLQTCICIHVNIYDNWEKIEKRFSIFEFRLGINFFHFRLGSFKQVEERLGSPVAGVEINTGGKRELFYTFQNKAERRRTNTF